MLPPAALMRIHPNATTKLRAMFFAHKQFQYLMQNTEIQVGINRNVLDHYKSVGVNFLHLFNNDQNIIRRKIDCAFTPNVLFTRRTEAKEPVLQAIYGSDRLVAMWATIKKEALML